MGNVLSVKEILNVVLSVDFAKHLIIKSAPHFYVCVSKRTGNFNQFLEKS